MLAEFRNPSNVIKIIISMKSIRLLLLPILTILSTLAVFGDNDRVFEMRTYYANEGKLDDLLTRFRDHTVALFEKHGMENVGYFVPAENTENTLVYFLSYPSREARQVSWKAFSADSDWKAAFAASKVNGKLVGKVENRFLTFADYSPKLKIKNAKSPRLFELRTYTAAEGMLEHLDNRFEQDTIRIFKKHGMTNVAYWHPMEDQEGHGNTLVYLLAFDSKEAQDKAWDGFRNDPDWKAVAKRSMEKAGGGLLVTKGVKSISLNPADFSPMQ